MGEIVREIMHAFCSCKAFPYAGECSGVLVSTGQRIRYTFVQRAREPDEILWDDLWYVGEVYCDSLKREVRGSASEYMR